MDIDVNFNRPTFKELKLIVDKRLEISGLEKYKFTDRALKQIYEKTDSIRDMFNLLRKSLDSAEAKGEKKIDNIELPKKKKALEVRGSKPADDAIFSVLRKQEGLKADEIVKKTEMSNPWIRHRLADLVREGILTKQQIARNKPARYYLAGEEKK
jgi:predicted DNA-binding transcriptional regulator